MRPFSRRALASAVSLAFVLAVASPLGVASCVKKGDPVDETVRAIASAAERRDADGVVRLLAASYRGPEGETRDETRLMVMRYLAAYQSLHVTLRDLSVDRSSSAARVTFRADLAGVPKAIGGLEGLFPSTSSWRFELRLAPDRKAWTVTSAAWAPAE